MSVLWRILSVAALAVSAGLLILSIISVRREQRVRPGLDLLRLGITLATTLADGPPARRDDLRVPHGRRVLGGPGARGVRGPAPAGALPGEGHLRPAHRPGGGGLGPGGGGGPGRRGRSAASAWPTSAWPCLLLGVGQVVGLLTGRWQTVMATRRAAAGSVAGPPWWCWPWPGPCCPAWGRRPPPPTPWTSAAVMAGQVPGVTVEVRGNGSYCGPALSLTFTNETGADVAVSVPVGLQFLPGERGYPDDDRRRRGDHRRALHRTGRAGSPVMIQAFCGQYHDDDPLGWRMSSPPVRW